MEKSMDGHVKGIKDRKKESNLDKHQIIFSEQLDN